jgi:hypothetical protein
MKPDASGADAVIDFRMERLRRALRKSDAGAALAVAKQYAEDGLPEAQYLVAQMLASSARPEDSKRAIIAKYQLDRKSTSRSMPLLAQAIDSVIPLVDSGIGLNAKST